MKILIVGSGGREHAIAWKLGQSENVTEIICAPGNAGTHKIARNINIQAQDIKSILQLSLEEKPDLVVIGPEVPLSLGLADLLQKNEILVFGPNQKAAEIESSKAFSKKLMKDANIPTAEFEIFNDPKKAKDFVHKEDRKWVIKASGLAAGKGVIITSENISPQDAITEIMEENTFGNAGNTCVIEEFIEGEEASLLVFTDGENIFPLPPAQDHKQIWENDLGPNTGGMGAYSPAPILPEHLQIKAIDSIIKPIINTLSEQGRTYRGILYTGLMITEEDMKVLEFNCRFGDPECQPIMMRMKGDLLPMLIATAKGDISKTNLEYYNEPSVCVVMSAGGYPGSYETNEIIHGIEEASAIEDVVVFHAGTSINKDGKTLTSGGRVLGITSKGSNLNSAISSAYSAVELINWKDCYYRKDIGAKAI
ncbi:MAG: phosphoribosylamine--glycine ligase [Nitrospinota bacterium]|nr:phosphoribosylamine--glycine ligase [Nitrospinota bacterium]